MMSKKETGYRYWSPEEDEILKAHVMKNGLKDIQKETGLNRSDKSCRIRWQKYIEPFVNMAPFTPQEEAQVIHFHSILGNHWGKIAHEIPGRSGSEIKYFWTKFILQTSPFGSRQQQDYVSEAPGNPKNGILASASGSSQLPIVYPNPNMNSIAQVPSITGINSEQCSSNSGVCSEVSMPPLNEQVESDSSTDEESLYGAVKRFLKLP